MSKTLTLDMKQLMEIFEAGVARGEDEQSSYDWGTTNWAWELEDVT